MSELTKEQQKIKDNLNQIKNWNQKFPCHGTPVDVTDDFGKVTRRHTESVPWVLGNEVVILVTGISGGYLLERCKPVNEVKR